MAYYISRSGRSREKRKPHLESARKTGYNNTSKIDSINLLTSELFQDNILPRETHDSHPGRRWQGVGAGGFLVAGGGRRPADHDHVTGSRGLGAVAPDDRRGDVRGGERLGRHHGHGQRAAVEQRRRRRAGQAAHQLVEGQRCPPHQVPALPTDARIGIHQSWGSRPPRPAAPPAWP